MSVRVFFARIYTTTSPHLAYQHETTQTRSQKLNTNTHQTQSQIQKEPKAKQKCKLLDIFAHFLRSLFYMAGPFAALVHCSCGNQNQNQKQNPTPKPKIYNPYKTTHPTYLVCSMLSGVSACCAVPQPCYTAAAILMHHFIRKRLLL